MSVKQNVSSTRKDGEITRSERTSVIQQTESTLKGIKEKAGEVVVVAITSRTSIVLPAHLTMEEREARVAKYISLHQSKI